MGLGGIGVDRDRAQGILDALRHLTLPVEDHPQHGERQWVIGGQLDCLARQFLGALRMAAPRLQLRLPDERLMVVWL